MTKASPLEAARDWLGSGALVAVSGRVLAAIAIVGATYLLVQTMQAGLKRLRRRAKAVQTKGATFPKEAADE